jgi:hypothetical protein
MEDEIIRESLVTYQGRVVQPSIVQLVERLNLKSGQEVARP